ncbi:tyrosine-type recombinase/integrase, partial [Pediococcus acidilactici]|uniref:tyrosine-type recombinase/integrase n=1 Tax=Pediococcus acidilactici TaxID=1254 RepID=UPI00319750EA
MHLSDVDWNTRRLRIVRRDNPNHAYAKGRERDLSIVRLMQNAHFCEIVSEYLDEEYPHEVVQHLKHGMMFVVLHRGSPSYGQPLEPQNLNKLLKRLKQKTGIDVERLYPHLFRHTFATHNIREGRRQGKEKETIAKTVQRQLGHGSIRTTLDIYDHSFNVDELVDEIERVVKCNDTSTTT